MLSFVQKGFESGFELVFDLAMNIAITLKEEAKRGKLPDDETSLGFGRIFTDHMFKINSAAGQWSKARIEPFSNLILSPAALVLHYGQEIFEGMKAFRQANGKDVSFFRPEKNAERMAASAERVAMDPLPPEIFLQGLHKLVAIDKHWVPSTKGTALYIRPTMIATEELLGLRRSKDYLFYIILSPVGPYFSEGFKPISIFVETQYVRAVIGGTGEAKTGGNYAASLLGLQNAYDAGCNQVMWLDAKEHRFVEEVGTMNQFFVMDDIIYTAPLTGTILRGITRDSVITLAKEKGYKVKEKSLAIDQILAAITEGKLTEAFGAGTAASIAPVGTLSYKGKQYTINSNQVGPITKELYETLIGIQYGSIDDPFGWNVPVQDLD